MQSSRLPFRRPSLAFALLILFFAVLWVAGGASRGDVLGQPLVRLTSWVLVIVLALFGNRPAARGSRAVTIILSASILLVLIQLVPLPPAVWQSLPGRAMLTDAATLSGQAQPWRPLTIVPAATLNAASSLIVPAITLVLTASLEERERRGVVDVLLWLTAAGALIGILQFSSGGFDNPLVNDSPGAVSGMFANRNHFALFLAIGCVTLPVWAVASRERWRKAVAIGLLPLFVLTILASGSRAGLLLGGLAVVLGLLIARRGIKRALRGTSRWVLPVTVAAVVALPAVLVATSIVAGRAVSLQRAFAMDVGQDFRGRAMPTVWQMIVDYWPAGSGFGAFDPIFRMHEPFALLKGTFFNHAHNDYLEIVLDGGVLSGLLLLAAIGWWLQASIRAWRIDDPLAQLGSAAIFLILLASTVDYPGRTPMMMALIVVSALWLSREQEVVPRSALPDPGY